MEVVKNVIVPQQEVPKAYPSPSPPFVTLEPSLLGNSVIFIAASPQSVDYTCNGIECEHGNSRVLSFAL